MPETLPEGCRIVPFHTHRDERGALTEIFRSEWSAGIEPVQWNFVRSAANVLRGVHVHTTHTDYLTCLEGSLLLGLHDIRDGSPTEGRSAFLELRGDEMRAVTIPVGVAHGFYFSGPSLLCYAVSHYWDIRDELGCRWNDPALRLDWPTLSPELSKRDQTAGGYAEMRESWRLGSHG